MGYDLIAKIYNPIKNKEIEKINSRYEFSRRFCSTVYLDETWWIRENLPKEFELIKSIAFDVDSDSEKAIRKPKEFLDAFQKIKEKLSKEKKQPVYYWLKVKCPKGKGYFLTNGVDIKVNNQDWMISGGLVEKVYAHTAYWEKKQKKEYFDNQKIICFGNQKIPVIKQTLYEVIKKELDLAIDLCENAIKRGKKIMIRVIG